MSIISRISDKSITVVIGGRVRSVSASSVNFPKLRDALKQKPQDLDLIKDLVDIPSFIARETHGRVSVSNDEVRFENKPVHGVIATRILSHLREGIDISPLANFLDRLMNNPLEGVRDDLFEWLERGDMPVTEDGFIIAYKKVQEDYYSYHSGKRGKVLHAPNTVVTMPREEVDPDRRNECSYGLHFCSYSYLYNYYGGQGRVLIVKIDPADVVAIPTDYNRAKGRTWRMEVIDEIVPEELGDALGGRLVISKQGSYEAGVASTARISDYNDNLLGQDGNGNNITEARLRGLLAHGGIAYTAQNLGLSEDRISAWVEVIDYPLENLGTATDAPPQALPAPEPDTEEVVEEPAAPKAKKAKGLSFTHNGVTYTAKVVAKGVEKHGQRGFSSQTGVPRSTLQGWLKTIANA